MSHAFHNESESTKQRGGLGKRMGDKGKTQSKGKITNKCTFNHPYKQNTLDDLHFLVRHLFMHFEEIWLSNRRLIEYLILFWMLTHLI